MNPAGPFLFPGDKQLRQRQRHADALLLHIAVGVAVLQPFPGRVPGGRDIGQKVIKPVILQRGNLCLHSLILLKEMKRSHHSPVPGIGSHLRQILNHVLLANLRAHILSKELRHLLHLNGHRGIIRAQIRMSFPRIDNNQPIILGPEIKVNLLHHRSLRFKEINGNQSADRTGHLIQQPRRLIPILILRKLPNMGIGHRIHPSFIKEGI